MTRALAAALAAAVTVVSAVACADRPPVVSPGPVPPSVCPLEGCGGGGVAAIASAAPRSACAFPQEHPCEDLAPNACTTRALDAWSQASDDAAVACVARMMVDACQLGDAPGCSFAGRMTLDGRGLPADTRRGIGLLDQACSDGVEAACWVAVRWLADAGHLRSIVDGAAIRHRLEMLLDCYTGTLEKCEGAAEDYASGRSGFPRDLARSAMAYERACVGGQPIACNNLADHYEYGDGVARDLAHAASLYERACRDGHALGCANLGHMIEIGDGRPRDVARARVLYRDACTAGESYGCLHAEMLDIGSPTTPEDLRRWVARWESACAARSARACAFVGLLYEDGPDGYARDHDKSREAMARGCKLGEPRACEWLQR